MKTLRLAALFLLLPLACGRGPTDAEYRALFSGVFTLSKAGGAALPFGHVQGTNRSEMLSATLSLEWLTGSSGTCSFTTTYRELSNGQIVAEGTETSACTFVDGTGYVSFDLEFSGVAAQGRFVSYINDTNAGAFSVNSIRFYSNAGTIFDFVR
jgi:hypothetical protein